MYVIATRYATDAPQYLDSKGRFTALRLTRAAQFETVSDALFAMQKRGAQNPTLHEGRENWTYTLLKVIPPVPQPEPQPTVEEVV